MIKYIHPFRITVFHCPYPHLHISSCQNISSRHIFTFSHFTALIYFKMEWKLMFWVVDKLRATSYSVRSVVVALPCLPKGWRAPTIMLSYTIWLNNIAWCHEYCMWCHHSRIQAMDTLDNSPHAVEPVRCVKWMKICDQRKEHRDTVDSILQHSTVNLLYYMHLFEMLSPKYIFLLRHDLIFMFSPFHYM